MPGKEFGQVPPQSGVEVPKGVSLGAKHIAGIIFEGAERLHATQPHFGLREARSLVAESFDPEAAIGGRLDDATDARAGKFR